MGASYSSLLYRTNPRAPVDLVDAKQVDLAPTEPPHLWGSGVLPQTAACAAGFVVLNALLPRILSRLVPGFTRLPAKTQRDAVYYVSSLLHHCVVTPWSLALLVRDAREGLKGAGHHIDYSPNLRLVPFFSGYIVADFLGTLGDLAHNPSFFLHHALTLALVACDLRKPQRWIPHVVLCEASR